MLALTSEHRRDLRDLTNLAESDLASLWRGFTDPVEARTWLMDVLPSLSDTYAAAAATLAADYYDELRDRAEVRRRFQAIVADVPDVAQTDVLARVAVGSLFGAKPNPSAALTIARGGLQRAVANTDRLTITTSAVADRSARGWQRVGKGDCDFCRMLIGRGAVYSEATADFEAHDHCGCVAEPVFT